MSDVPQKWLDAVSRKARVRLTFADGSTRAEGNVIAHSIVPSVIIVTDTGERVSWRHDMAEILPPGGSDDHTG